MSSNGSLRTRYGREVKVYKIKEYGKTYFGLFYRSTGTGNPKFEDKFVDTLVPFYCMEKDKTTITKAILIRDEVYGKRTFFKWQLELLQYLSTKTNSVMLRDILTLLDNYFNTSGEILISINDGKGFWARNTNITSEIIKFFKEKKIESNGVEVLEDVKKLNIYEKELKTNWTQSAQILVQQEQYESYKQKLKSYKQKLKSYWTQSAQILVKQEQEERLAEKIAALRLRKEKKEQEERMAEKKAALRLRKEHPDAQRTSGGRRKRSSKTRRSMRKGNKKKRVKTRRRK